MKKFLTIIVISLLISVSAFAKKYKVNDVVEDQFHMTKKFKIDLPKGKWILAEKTAWSNWGLSSVTFTLVKIKKKKVSEAIEIGEFRTAGVMENIVNNALNEIMYRNEYDGCYERPEYTVLEFYKKGSTHNCFWVGHRDLYKEIYNPDDPEMIGANAKIKKWLKENKITLPKVALYSDHSYFSRLASGKWYILSYIIDPKVLNAPENKFITENTSEYHKYNISNHPEHEEIMKKWISISAKRHLDFENSINAKQRHRLELNNLSPAKSTTNDNQSSDMIEQLQKLNDLFNSGALTKKEFEKAKKKLLN